MGYVGIDRGLRDHWIYQDAEYLKVWLEMIFLARFSDDPHNELIDGDIITIDYGEFIFGRVKWSQRLKIGEQRLRTLISKLKKEQMIELVIEHRKCSVYRLVNYAKFNHEYNHQSSLLPQDFEKDANHHSNQQPTISQPSPNHQSTTKEQSKQRNKVNKEIKYTVEFEEFWRVYPRRLGKVDSLKAWERALKAGHPPILITLCAENYAKECQIKQTEERFIKHPTTFLNNERFKDHEVLNVTSITRSHTNTGKPSMPVVKDIGPQKAISPEEREKMRELARKLRGDEQDSA